jgi:pimeloyl-ACP methyl ester carboxylesterase
MKIYKSEKAKINIHKTYDHLLSQWGVAFEEKDIPTTYGNTHVIMCGSESSPPLVLFHGVGDDSALMWIYNAKELAAHFRIYAVDTIGGPGKSQPNCQYNRNFDELKWLDELFDQLHLDSFYIAGVSMGSYITQHYGIMRPEKVLKLICMTGSVSIRKNGSPLKRMVKVFLPEALFPTEKNVTRLIKKLAGDNYCVFTKTPAIMNHYGYLLRGFNSMAMSYHKIKAFEADQLASIKDKTLFLLGEMDPLGDSLHVKATLDEYCMNYRFFPGVGHGINHEIADEINKIIIQYFNEPA